MPMEKETIIWLAGLISTDGSIVHRVRHGGYRLRVSSVEREWLNLVQKRLKEIGIKSRIDPPQGRARIIEINDTEQVLNLFVKYSCQQFFNPRKWKIVREALQYYNWREKLAKRHNNKPS